MPDYSELNNDFQTEQPFNSNSTDSLQPGGIQQSSLLSILAIYAVIAFIMTFALNRWQFARDKQRNKKITPLYPRLPSPCHQCRFFSSNCRCHCIVHPSKVLKPEAYSCPDYWSGKSNTFSS